ncbi:MAG: hypothetical protein K2Y21_12530 [Phycisphaerales bacterium]|nr:hypothetical protein [Phycisphaerales bacterium]
MAQIDFEVASGVLPPSAPTIAFETEAKPPVEPPLDAPVIDDSLDNDTPLEWPDGDTLAPVSSTEEEEGGEAIPVAADDGGEPPANTLAVSAASDDDDEGNVGDAMVKRFAAGKPHREGEVRLITEMAKAIRDSELSQTQLDESLFVIGRNAHRLNKEFGWSLKRIGKAVNYSESRLSQLRSNYLAFPTPESRLGMNFSACLEARTVHSRLAKKLKKTVSPTQILQEIREKKLSVRGAAAHFNQQAIKDAKKKALDRYEAELAENPELHGKVFNADCLDVLREMPDKSVKLIHADPPYAEFWKALHQGYESGRESVNGLRIDCENNTAEEAVPLMIKMFQLARRVVRDDGCLVFWSAGMHADRPEIVLAAREAGWECRFAGYWRKRLTQPGNFSWPWTTSVERFLVWYPVGGDEPLDHSQELPRTDVIGPDDLDKMAEFKSPSQSAHGDFIAGRKDIGDVHMFEKPIDLCRYFIQKLTYPGDPVIDLFGCSGNFCIAAEQEKRPWTYIELDKTNFDWGVGRIYDAMGPHPKPPQFEGDADDPLVKDLPF